MYIGLTRTTVCGSRLGDTVVQDKDIATSDPETTLRQAIEIIEKWEPGDFPVIGVAGSPPLNPRKGTIEGHPGLPEWKNVEVISTLKEALGGQSYLMNWADAGALAEWWFGAGKGTEHMVFLSVGNDLGAGLILNGRLYSGVTNRAGAIGHIRLASDGPEGDGKTGSVAAFCGSGGIARMAQAVALEHDGVVAFNPGSIEKIETVHVAKAAEAGDTLAKELLADAGAQIGKAVAILIDLINPEKVVMGSLFQKCRPFLEKPMRRVLEQEALPDALAACDIVPAKLGNRLPAQSALAAGFYFQEKIQRS